MVIFARHGLMVGNMLRLPVVLSWLLLLHDGKEVWSFNCWAPISCRTQHALKHRDSWEGAVCFYQFLSLTLIWVFHASLIVSLLVFVSFSVLSLCGLFFCFIWDIVPSTPLSSAPVSPFVSELDFCLPCESQGQSMDCAHVEHGCNADIFCQHQHAILNAQKLLLLLSHDIPAVNKVF